MLKWHLLLPALLVMRVVAFGGELRTWRSVSGSEIEASLAEQTSSTVVLVTKDGKIFRIAPHTFSKADQAYLKELSLREKYQNPEYQKSLESPDKTDEWLAFLKWKQKNCVSAGNPVFTVLFPSAKHFDTFQQSPIEAINIKTVNANKITLSKNKEHHWFMCRSRFDIEQITEDVYKTTLLSIDMDSIRLYFTKDQFNAVSEIPEDVMANHYGPLLCYLYGRVGKYDYVEGILMGEVPQAETDN